MEFQNVLEQRRSIRQYTAQPVEDEKLHQMIQAATLAPSWKNSQVTRYYVVKDSKKLAEVTAALAEFNQKNVVNAPVLIIPTIVLNRSGFERDGSPTNELGNGWGCYDLGLQNENLILKAEELGYGTLIMGIRDADKIRVFCSVPETETVVAVIAVGVPGEEPGRPKRKDTEEIVKFL